MAVEKSAAPRKAVAPKAKAKSGKAPKGYVKLAKNLAKSGSKTAK